MSELRPPAAPGGLHLHRRVFLGLTVAAAAAIAAGQGRAAAEPRRPRGAVPAVLAAAGRARRVQSPGFAVHHLGLSWKGGRRAGRVRLRYPGGWTDWLPVGSTDSADRDRHNALLWVGSAGAYEFVPERGNTAVRLHAINTVDGPPTSRRFSSGQDLRAQLAVHHPSRLAYVPYYSRAAWGADESLRFASDGTESLPTVYIPVQTLTVHHTVTLNSDPDPAATVRAVYFFQTITQDFGDVGYHLLIDQQGRVYEGRYSGPDPFPVFGPLSVRPWPQMNNGAHVAGFNAGNVGVALLGDFTSTQPTPAARRSLTLVLALLAVSTRLDPTGTTDYVNPISGATRTVRTIAGHRDWAATECPGDTFYPTLPRLRQEVAAVVDRVR